jgi:hypothetical protein
VLHGDEEQEAARTLRTEGTHVLDEVRASQGLVGDDEVAAHQRLPSLKVALRPYASASTL